MKSNYSNMCNCGYSNYLTQEQYENKTTAGKIIADVGGVAGILNIASNVANTVQQNRSLRNNQNQVTSNNQQLSDAQIKAIQFEANRRQKELEEANRKRKQQQILLIVGVLFLFVVLLIIFVKKK